jgi:guanylate kinase
VTPIDELLLVIICSPSGAGKTTLTKRLLQRFGDDVTFSVSHTTREMRKNEVEGQDYHFVAREVFEEMVKNDLFAEYAEVHGNFYGTSLGELDRARRDDRKAILFDVDYQGARQIKAKLPRAVGIFILPPSMEELHRRLVGRGTDANEAIETRFRNARIEIEHYGFFDYLIVNDNVNDAAQKLEGIVHAERCKRSRMAPRAESLLRTGKT